MKKSFIVIITLLLMVSLSSCFSNTSKVTNNSINNKVINVEDYTINDVQDAIVTASEKAEASVVAIIENSLTSSSLGSAVVVKRTAYNGTDIVDDNSSNITHYEYYAITNEHVINGIVNFQYRVFLGDQIGNKDYQTFLYKRDWVRNIWSLEVKVRYKIKWDNALLQFVLSECIVEL